MRRLASSTVGCLLVLSSLSGCEPDTTWRQAFDATESGWLMNVWGPSRDDVFVVGGEPERGAILRERGGEWGALDLPEGTPLVNWAWGFGGDDVTFVANGGTVLHFDGATFEVQSTPTEEDLWGIWGTAPDDLWAVGGSGFEDSEVVILHFDGTSWELAAIPPLERDAHGLFKVWGSGPNDVYAVGHRGLVLHWDGAAWTELFVGASDDLVSLWGTGPDHIVAVGGRSNGIVSFFDGTSWTTHILEGGVPGLNGVWMREPGVAHVNGILGTLLTVEVSSGAESFPYEDQSIDDRRTFHSIHGVDGRLLAVGGTIGLPTPFEGMAYERELAGDE